MEGFPNNSKQSAEPTGWEDMVPEPTPPPTPPLTPPTPPTAEWSKSGDAHAGKHIEPINHPTGEWIEEADRAFERAALEAVMQQQQANEAEIEAQRYEEETSQRQKDADERARIYSEGEF